MKTTKKRRATKYTLNMILAKPSEGSFTARWIKDIQSACIKAMGRRLSTITHWWKAQHCWLPMCLNIFQIR